MTETATANDRATLYRADWVLPVSAPVLADGGLLVAGDRIVAVGPAADLEAAHPGAEVVDLGRAIVLPGFVNCHSHLEYTTFRGILDDAEFGDWILQLVDVKASLTPDEYLDSARLGAAECVASGITTVADTSYTGLSIRAAGEAGLRGRVYLEVYGIDDTRIDETLRTVDRRLEAARSIHADHIGVGLMPHAPYTVSSRLYEAIAERSRAEGLPVASHVAESRHELTYVRAGSGKFAHDFREKLGWERMLVQPYGVSPVKYLQQWGVFDRDFLAVHCTQATLDDIRILRAKDTAVAHCPKSNAKLGCGVAPLADILHQGVRVGLGTDSPASSNIMDMFDEMRTMLLLHRATERDVSVLDAERCVRLATLGGAEALGLAGEIGSLEPGKAADFIAVDVSRSRFEPIANPYSALVYGANQDDVFLTVVAGRILYRDRAFTAVDDAAVRRAAQTVRERLQERVREGVQVGAAGSGWWRPAPVTSGRER
ncbi:MAG TPA: amidohydrolase [Thermoleophilia bacterium]|nr:amidohydrolase [Thermoleophilia bacterium]HQG54747.1 amidohydrolase [Thermoleophilia bacterium]HQJ97688.1 amidohydrolase [Thermoleophilia bacterium]